MATARSFRSGRGVVEAKELWCVFRNRAGQQVTALRDVSFRAEPGKFVCVVGRSGHGKTTLLRVIAGLQSPTRGSIEVDGEVVTGPGSDRVLVFQQDTVFPWLSVQRNVEYGLRAQGLSKTECASIAQDWLRAVGLEGSGRSWPRELSGGMRKRVALAAALAAGRGVWLMDEPFGSLDYFTRRALHTLVLGLWHAERHTVFFVTHDIEEALILADRILVVDKGSIVRDVEVNLARPRTEEVRATQGAVELSRDILDALGVSDGGTL